MKDLKYMNIHNKKINRVSIIIGVLGLLCFGPSLLLSSINIGNVTGILVSILFVFYGLQSVWIKHQINLLWKRRMGKIILSLVGAICVCIILIVLFLSTLMIKANLQKPSEHATVVVLGCRVYGEKPSLMLIERLDAAYEYLSINKDTQCILSGGKGPGESISEAECMYRYLVDKGIDGNRLHLEKQSTSTRENIQFSKAIIAEKGLEEQVALVTNEFHEYRAMKIAKDLNLEASAIPGWTAWWLFPTFYVRELYGVVYELTGL